MIEVEVGDTIVEFPDGTSPDVMRSALQRRFGAPEPEKAPEPERKIGAFDYPSHYKQMVSESTGLMGEGVDQIKRGGLSDVAIGTGKTALGGLGYLTSPINAALRTTIGQPLEAVVGIPKEYSEFAAGAMLPIPKRIPLPSGTKTAAPSIDELKSAYVAAKEAPEVGAAVIRPASIEKAVDNISNKLVNKEWLDPELAPQTFRIIGKLREDGAATMQTVDSARRRLGNVIERGGNDGAAAFMAKRDLDDWMKGATQADAIAGDIPAAQAIMQEGRGNYASAKASENLDKRIAKAELQTAGSHSGLNLQNQLKQKVTQFLGGSDSRGLSSTQRAALESFVEGSRSENVLRYVGKLFGGGGGLGTLTTAGVGGMAFGGWGTVLPVVGFSLTKLGNSLSLRNANKLSEMIRSESPLARRMQGPLEDWGKAIQEAEISPTARNISRLTIASRNLSHNLEDIDITVSPNELLRSIQGPGSAKGDREDRPRRLDQEPD